MTSDTPDARAASATNLRFRGFPPAARRFFEELDRTRSAAPERADYVAWVLSPLKTLTADLAGRLANVQPPLSLVPRIDGSLTGAGADGALVRRLRAWDARSLVETSPLLYADLGAAGIDVGAASAGADPEATARVRRALLQTSDDSLRATCAALLAGGWQVLGEPLPDAEDGSLPDDLRPWLVRRDLRVQRLLPWDAWIDDPELAGEIADRFRELLPLFDAMRAPLPVERPTARAAEAG
ncbi:MAG: hypothetical protein U0167_04495 [bacterium]